MLTVALTDTGMVFVRAADETETAVGRYAANRWYNLKLRVAPVRREASLEWQDDRLGVEKTGNLKLGSSDAIARVALEHGGPRPGSWIIYNALSAYQR